MTNTRDAIIKAALRSLADNGFDYRWEDRGVNLVEVIVRGVAYEVTIPDGATADSPSITFCRAHLT